MIDENNNSNFPFGVSNEDKCVWMSAGVVSYKLCNLEFDCEHCAYDIIIRFKISSEIVNGKYKISNNSKIVDYSEQAKMLIDKLMDVEIDPAYYYSKNHICLCDSDPGMVLIGIDSLLANILNYLTCIVLLPVGESVKQRKSFCWLIQQGRTLTLYSPISGTVVQNNTLLINSPDLIRSSDFQKSWLTKVKLNKDSRLEEFYTGEKAQVWFQNELKRTKYTFYEIIEKQRTLKSPTQFDGGLCSTSLSEIIPYAEYWTILRKLCFPK